MGNEDTLSTEPVWNNTPSETASQVCNNLNENTAGWPFSEVKNYKLENPKNITIGHLNINSLRNKFNSIRELIKSKLDIFIVLRRKLTVFRISSSQYFSTSIKCPCTCEEENSKV